MRRNPNVGRMTLLALILSILYGGNALAASCIGICGTLGANGDVTAPPNDQHL